MRAPRSGPAAFTGFLLIDLVVPLASYYVLRARAHPSGQRSSPGPPCLCSA